jgi:hypothetical protein
MRAGILANSGYCPYISTGLDEEQFELLTEANCSHPSSFIALREVKIDCLAFITGITGTTGGGTITGTARFDHCLLFFFTGEFAQIDPLDSFLETVTLLSR